MLSRAILVEFVWGFEVLKIWIWNLGEILKLRFSREIETEFWSGCDLIRILRLKFGQHFEAKVRILRMTFDEDFDTELINLWCHLSSNFDESTHLLDIAHSH